MRSGFGALPTIKETARFIARALSRSGGSGLVGYDARVSYLDRTVGSKLVQVVSAKDFGAKGDGVTVDTSAMQAAIDALSAAGGGVLILPRGTYRCRNLLPRSNVWIQGEAGSKLIPHIDGANPVFYGWFVASNAVTIDNVRLLNLRCDFQGDLYPTTAPGQPIERGINCRNVSNWRIEGCDFFNNPGFQSIWLSDNSNPPKVQNVEVSGCSFRKFGRDVSGNALQTDHSCIYIQGDGVRVIGNTFVNDAEDVVATCVELHGSFITCANNVMRRANVGVILSAIHSDMRTVTVSGNSIDLCRTGVMVWQGGGFIPYDIAIDGNTISQYTHFGISTFQGNGSSTFGIGGGAAYGESWGITDNIIRYKTGAGADVVNFIGAGIRLHYCKSVTIDDNKFARVAGRAVLIGGGPLGGAEAYVSIRNNDLYLNEATLSATYKVGLQLGDAVATIDSFVVDGNFISDSFETGVYIDKAARSRVIDNEIYAGTAAITASNRQGTLYIRHDGDCKGADFSGYSGIELGSSIYDRSNATKWVRKKPVSPLPMNREVWADTLPGGAALFGDIWWSTNVGAGGSPGAYCTTGGGSPTWKAMAAVAA